MATPAAVLSILVTAKGFAETSAHLEKIEKQAERTSSSTDKLEKRFSHLDNTVGDFNRSMMGLRNVVGIVKWPAMIAGAGAAAQAIGALSAGAVGLGSALAPLAGAGAGAAVGFTALGQAAGVAKLAMGSIQKALTGNKKALEALTPTQKAFVEKLKSMRGELKGLQETAARGVMPGLNSALKSLQPLVATLKPIIAGTARALGDLAAAGGRMVGSWGKDLQTVGKANVTIIRNIGAAALSLASAFKDVIVVAGPLATWMSELVKQGGKWVASQVAAGRESGKLAGFLARTRDVMTTMGHIIANLAVGLFNIGKAAAPLGRDLLGVIEKLTARFREWTGSMQGQNALVQYFNNARPVIMQIGGLFGDLARALVRISAGAGASKMVEDLRRVVPVLEQLIAGTTAAFGPAVIAALTNIARLIGQLAGSSGPLVLVVQAISALAGALADLLQSSPLLTQMTVVFLGLGSAWKILLAVGAPLAGLLPALAGGFVVLKTAMISMQLALATGATATAAFKVGLQELFAAIRVSPLGILLTLVGVLAAAYLTLKGNQHQAAVTAREVADAWSQAAGAARALRDAHVAVTVAQLGLQRAQITEAQAQDNLTRLQRSGHASASALADAELAVKEAHVGTTEAANRLKDATANVTDAQRKATQTQADAVAKDKQRVETLAAQYAKMKLNGAAASDLRAKHQQLNDAVTTLNRDQGKLNSTLASMPRNVVSTVDVQVTFESNVIGAINAIAKSIGGSVQNIARATGSAGAPAHGGHFARGGMVNRPGYFAGEEAPVHKEVILATNPAYRKRNLGLWATAGGMLGVPGFARGGITAADEVSAIDPWMSRQASGWMAPKAKSWGQQQAQKLTARARAAQGTQGQGVGGGGPFTGNLGGGVSGHPELQKHISQVASTVLSKFPGLAITSTTSGNHVPGSYHYRGMAVDMGGSSSTMYAASEWIKASGLWHQLLEGIHNPDLAVKNYQLEVPPGVFGAVWAGHANHIHLAARKGGIYSGMPGYAKGGVVGKAAQAGKGGNVWEVRASQESSSSGGGWTELSPNGNGAARLGIPRSFQNNPGHFPDFASLGRYFPNGTLSLMIRGPRGSGTWNKTDSGDGSSFAPAIGLTPAVSGVTGGTGGTVQISRADGGDLHLFPGMGRLIAGAGGFGGGGASVTTTTGGGGGRRRAPAFKPTPVPKLKMPFKIPAPLDALIPVMPNAGSGPWGKNYPWGPLDAIRPHMQPAAFNSLFADMNGILDSNTGSVAVLADKIDSHQKIYDQLTSEYGAAHPTLDLSTGVYPGDNTTTPATPAAPDATYVATRIRELSELLNWQAQVKEQLKHALRIIDRLLPKLQAAIAQRQAEIKTISERVHLNMDRIGTLAQIIKVTKNRRAKSDLTAQMKALQNQNVALGGKANSVGTGGIIGILGDPTTGQIGALTDRFNTVTDTRRTLVGASGDGGTLLDATLGVNTFRDQLKVFSGGAPAAAAAIANAANAAGGAGSATGGTSGADSAALQEQLRLTSQLLTEANQRTAVANAQFEALKVPLIGSSFVGAFASGTSGTPRTGWTLVGERGPELMHAPGGTRILNANQTAAAVQPMIVVQVLDGAVNENRIRVLAGDQAQREMRKAGRGAGRRLPGAGGGA